MRVKTHAVIGINTSKGCPSLMPLGRVKKVRINRANDGTIHPLHGHSRESLDRLESDQGIHSHIHSGK